MKRIETKDGKSKVIMEWTEKKPHPKLWEWQFKLENVILSFIFVCIFVFIICLCSKMF